MGIRLEETLELKTQDEFYAIDKIVTGYSFETQNIIGKFCHEKIYQEIIAQQCYKNNIKAVREFKVYVSHKDFSKTYKIDLLVDNGIIYEFKTVNSLNNNHKQQLINYLLLTEIKHGKLLNFSSSSVEYEFVSTTITKQDRYNFTINSDEWISVSKNCKKLKKILSEILQKWGTYLECSLYRDALIHFLGGEEKVIKSTTILFNGISVGEQKMYLLDDKTSFHISAITKSTEGYEKDIQRLLKHTKIKHIQWINMNRQNIVIKTIKIKK